MTAVSLQIGHQRRQFKPERWFSSHQQSITLSLYTLSHPLITLSHPSMASNDNNKYNEEEAKELAVTTKKWPWLSNDEDDSSSGELEEETEEEEEVSSEESMNQPNSSEDKLMRKCAHVLDDGDTTSMESEPRSPGMLSSRVRTDPGGSDDDDDDFWM
jgi:hypothetical protein